MTQTQKFLKQIPDSSGCIPMPKAQVLRRVRLRGAEYTTRIEAWMAAHEQKRSASGGSPSGVLSVTACSASCLPAVCAPPVV